MYRLCACLMENMHYLQRSVSESKICIQYVRTYVCYCTYFSYYVCLQGFLATQTAKDKNHYKVSFL